MLKTLAAIIGNILKYSKIPTDIKSRDFDIKRSLFALFFAILVSLTTYSIKRLYSMTVRVSVQRAEIYALHKDINELERKLVNGKLKLGRCRIRSRLCKTIACAMDEATRH